MRYKLTPHNMILHMINSSTGEPSAKPQSIGVTGRRLRIYYLQRTRHLARNTQWKQNTMHGRKTHKFELASEPSAKPQSIDATVYRLRNTTTRAHHIACAVSQKQRLHCMGMHAKLCKNHPLLRGPITQRTMQEEHQKCIYTQASVYTTWP